MINNSVSPLKITLKAEQPSDSVPAIESLAAESTLLSASGLKSSQTAPEGDKLPVLQLPSDFPKTPSTPYQAGYQDFFLSDTLVQPLNYSFQLDTSEVRSLLLAAFSALLYRYTQQTDIYLGLNIVRSVDQSELIPAGIQLHSELNGQELTHQIAATLEAYSQVNAQNASQEPQKPQQPLPIVVSCLDKIADIETAKQVMQEFQQRSYPSPADLELHLALLQQPDGIAGVLEYNTHLFTQESIKRLSEHWQMLLEGMVLQFDRPIAQLPFLTSAERQQLLVEWSSAAVDYPQIPIHQHIESHAAARPDAIALRFKDQHLTYSGLNQRANQLAHYLIQVGVKAGDRVAVCTQPSLESIVSLLAIFKAGGTYVPLDSTHPMERLITILEDTQANVLLTQTSLQANLPTITEYILCLDQDWGKIDTYSDTNPAIEIDLDETAYIIYTSGTTGKPKGVMASYRNMINYILATQERFGFNSEDVMPAVARFTFSIAIFELLSPLAAGGTLFLLEREHILDFGRMARTLEQLTMLHTVPSLMQKLLAHITENELDLQKYQGVKYVFTGGDIVAPDLLEAMRKVFRNAQVYVLYGCSEVSSLCANYAVPMDEPVTKSRIGRPFNNVSIRVYDPDQNLVPIGVPGEIYVGGAGVTTGYLHRNDLTQEKFVTIDGQRFYRTGDLGRFRSDGNVEFLGRADFQVKLRGIRIELGDIETALRQAPGVREGVVTACELGNRDEKSLVAYVVLDQNQNPTIGEIRRFLQSKLPDYMVPAGFVVLEALPLNPNQKVDRRALPQPTAENLAGLETIVPARNASDQRLIEIWEALLGVSPIGIHNNFFELGGNSLLAVQMLTEVEKHWGKQLAITTLLQASTIADLVDVLDSNEIAEGTGDLVPLRATGRKPPLFCIYGILLYQSLVNRLDPDQPVYGVYLQEEVELLKTGQFDQFNSVFATVPTIATRYLEAIRAFQPHGPYYLAGESFGGVVAYEMAQQLQAAGEEVALVALFDSWMTSSGREQTPLLPRVKQHIQFLSEQGVSYLTQRMQRRSEIIRRKILTKLPQTYQKANSGGKAPALSETRQKDIRAEIQNRASQAYKPKPYDGRIVLFRAMERYAMEPSNSYDMGWGSLSRDGLHIFEIPGDHLGIFERAQCPSAS